MAFQKAERKQVKLKIALIGPSGSGKTFSALTLAKGLGGKTALGDTEGHRSEYYADKFDFDVMHMVPPFSPEAYIELINESARGGYNTLIIDSASHEWMGKGGCLELLETLKRTGGGGNDFTVWAKVTPRHNAFLDAIVNAPMHVIICLRGKDEYVLEENDKGKKVPRKVGVGAQMRDGLEYECTVALLLDLSDHAASVTKDNTGIFENSVRVITVEDGKKLAAWASSGASGYVPEVAAPTVTKPAKAVAPAPTVRKNLIVPDTKTTKTTKTAVKVTATRGDGVVFAINEEVLIDDEVAIIRTFNETKTKCGLEYGDGEKRWHPLESLDKMDAPPPDLDELPAPKDGEVPNLLNDDDGIPF